MRHLPLIVMLVLGSLAGCSLLLGEGFSGGAAEVDSAGDAGADAPASTTDALADVPPRGDGGDADADAGPLGTCVAPAGLVTRLCDDFERTFVRGGWTFDSGRLALVEDPAKGSKVVRVDVPSPDGGTGQSFLRFDASVLSRFYVRYAIKIAAYPAVGTRQLVPIQLSGASTGAFIVYLTVDPAGQWRLVEQVDPSGGGPNETAIHPFPNSYAVGEWHTVSLDVDFGQDALTILIDGTSPLPAGTTYPKLALFAGTKLETSLGLRYSPDPGTPMTVFFDDVVIATN